MINTSDRVLVKASLVIGSGASAWGRVIQMWKTRKNGDAWICWGLRWWKREIYWLSYIIISV